MGDAHHENKQYTIANFVHNAEIADPDSPSLSNAFKLLCPGRPRVRRKAVDMRSKPHLEMTWELSKIALGGGGEINCVGHADSSEG